VTALGTHEELVRTSALYREVFEHQRLQGTAGNLAANATTEIGGSGR
jgi:hypothetical protein